jgi:hypothetical protein
MSNGHSRRDRSCTWHYCGRVTTEIYNTDDCSCFFSATIPLAPSRRPRSVLDVAGSGEIEEPLANPSVVITYVQSFTSDHYFTLNVLTICKILLLHTSQPHYHYIPTTLYKIPSFPIDGLHIILAFNPLDLSLAHSIAATGSPP